MNNSIRDLLSQNRGHVHLVGVCGVGMAGLAFLLKSRGFEVSGCDLAPGDIARWLTDNGIKVLHGHDPAHITSDVEWVVRTSAVSPNSDEITHAVACGREVFRRGEVLASMLAGSRSVAVAGTHGKTTVTGFIAQVLRSCGKDPSFSVGGQVDALGGVAGAGQGGIMVVEADESDGTLALYEPDFAVITNVEHDHMEHFQREAALKKCFRRFMDNARQRVIYCADDPGAAGLADKSEGGDLGRFLSYGMSETAAVRGADLCETACSLSFSVEREGTALGRLELPVPGRHNALNALAVVAVALEMGMAFDEIKQAFKSVSLARRRFERVVDTDDVAVISDYAHHPSEIKAFLRTVRRQGRARMLAVFQPHRYTRTLALGQDFASAFDGVDELILTPVYAASEKPLKGGTMWDLYAHFRNQRLALRSSQSEARVFAAESLEQAWSYIRRNLRRGDMLLVVGAGDVEKIAYWAREEYRSVAVPEYRRTPAPPDSLPRILSYDVPLSGKTTMRVGGRADMWLEIRGETGLKSVLQWSADEGIPFRLLGGGSNLLVSDLGVRGIVGRLAGREFRRIREEGGLVVAGAGLPLAGLLDWIEERGLSGLEFLEGIPGTVGGAVRMNAGAFGDEIGAHVAWVRCLDTRGSETTLKRPKFSYRSGIKGVAILEAGLIVARGEGEAAGIRERRAAARSRRVWMKGLRCAGSVFMNPENDFAGRLIEQAGLKGVEIGGATISKEHANVIVTKEGACATDVRALMELARSEVLSHFGVELKNEIEIWD